MFDISKTLVHNVVYAWANFLCVSLKKFFPSPTRSQMLRAYLQSRIRKFGNAKIFLILDATEIVAEVASMKTVNAILYSAYKHNSTLKWLAACDPIGVMHKDSIGKAHGGSISDPFATLVAKILPNLPFGTSAEVDKGFLIENLCALIGINCVRPMKRLDGQIQQSMEDTALTQKVGKTRIVIEQCNGGMKADTGFFDRKIQIKQIGLADKIFRSSNLLQNFSLPFIQDRDPEAPQTGRPCKAEIRYYGGTDDGLMDVRPLPEYWALDSELERWHELRNDESNNHLDDTQISELVFDEDWPAKLRKEHYDKLVQTFYHVCFQNEIHLQIFYHISIQKKYIYKKYSQNSYASFTSSL